MVTKQHSPVTEGS